jgi:hypothetical protein
MTTENRKTAESIVDQMIHNAFECDLPEAAIAAIEAALDEKDAKLDIAIAALKAIRHSNESDLALYANFAEDEAQAALDQIREVLT